MRHQSWSTEEGLPQDSVSQIAQTSDGFLWIATEGGLARFDGASFQSFNHRVESAFVSDDVCCLAAGGDALWIGTADGLIRLRAGRFTRLTEKDGLPSSAVRGIRVLPDGAVFVETASGPATWREERLSGGGPRERAGGGPSTEADVTRPAQQTAGGASWSFSNTAVAVKQGSYAREWRVGAELPGRRVETLLVDRGGTAWVGTNLGLALLTPHGEKAVPVPALDGNVVLQVFEDREGNYWIGTEASGLHVLRPVKFRTEASLAEQALTAVVESGAGTVWVGTQREGLRLFERGAVRTPAAPEALTSPVILSLAPGTKGSVWAGTPDGLNHVTATGAVQRITSANGLPDDYIQALANDGDAGVWIGTRRGLVHLRGTQTEVFTRAEGLGGDLVGALLQTREGDLWIATSGGLSQREPNGKITNYRLPGGPGVGVITAMTEAGGGHFWVGTSKGLVLRWLDGAFVPVFGSEASVPIDGMLADEQGFLWVRTQLGLDRLPIHGLQSLSGRCFRVDAPPRGSDLCLAQAAHFGLAEGLPSREVKPGGAPLMTEAGGELWFATRRGLAITDPRHLLRNPVAPPVVIERFLADETPLDRTGAPVAIPFGHLRFTIEYAGLSYTAPSEVRYSYKLEGLDQAWTDVGARRSATYTNLRPGTYRFRVRAMNNDGVWNETGAELPFRIVPPFYRRPWFIAVLVMLLAASVGGLYRLRLRGVRSQFEAVLQERNRMAREIHDTLAQDFVGVSLQLDILAQMLEAQKPEAQQQDQLKLDAAAEQVQRTRRLVTEGLTEARQSIWELRANLTEDSLPTRLSKVVERYSGEVLRISVRIGGAYRKLPPQLEAEVLRIAQEALSNVQRHSGSAEARVDLHYRSDMLVLTVEDHGKGFALDDALGAHGHYGLHGMRERASAVGGTLTIDTSLRGGTKITFAAPIAGADKVKNA